MSDEPKPFLRIKTAEGRRASVDNPVTPEEVAEARETISAALRDSRAEVPATNDPTPEEFGAAIQAERQRQVEKGYDAAHDRDHGLKHLLNWAIDYARRGKSVESAALILAALERVPESPAEVPADEGTLADLILDVLVDDITNDGAGMKWSDGAPVALALAVQERLVREMSTWFATELQKARADELEKLADELPPSPQRAAILKRAAAIRSQEPPTGQEQP
jgi:hypothetical protein